RARRGGVRADHLRPAARGAGCASWACVRALSRADRQRRPIAQPIGQSGSDLPRPIGVRLAGVRLAGVRLASLALPSLTPLTLTPFTLTPRSTKYSLPTTGC